MSALTLRFFNLDHELEFQFKNLEEIKTRMLLAVVIAIVSAVYMELFFWFKHLTLSFRVATYLNKFGFCLWFYFAFIFK